MGRPLAGTATQRAHEDEPEVAEAPRRRGGGARRDVALAVGTVVHRVLEEVELGGDPEAALARVGARVEPWLAGLVDAGDLDEALAEARAVLARLPESALAARLDELSGAVLARELPCLLRGGDEGPIGVEIGSIDLLYRDPASGELVVADYKTDRVVGDEELAERVGVYARQGAVYREAVEAAFGERARFELWFVALDRIVPA